MTMKEDFELDDEMELETIRGHSSKKPSMNLLNQKKVSKWEMDELLADDDYYEEV